MKIIFKVLILLLISLTFSNAELLNPNSTIKPKEVIKIQLTGLQKNDLNLQNLAEKIRRSLMKFKFILLKKSWSERCKSMSIL